MAKEGGKPRTTNTIPGIRSDSLPRENRTDWTGRKGASTATKRRERKSYHILSKGKKKEKGSVAQDREKSRGRKGVP